MKLSPISLAFKHYETALKALEEADSAPAAEKVLVVLAARDAVQTVLSDKTQDTSQYLISIHALDKRLENQASRINKVMKLSDLRSLSKSTPEAWWWFLDTTPHSFWRRFDWFWSALTIFWLTINLSLILDISSRFFSGTPDTLGTFAVIFQSVLAALAAGGALTRTGQELVDGFLKSLRINERYWQEAKLGLAALLSLGLVTFRHSLPQMAVFYNYRGVQEFNEGHLDAAKDDFTLALKLNSNYPEANYNLGRLYERLQDSKNAITQYTNASSGGMSDAYNSLGRLYILNKDYSTAIILLLRGKELVERDVASPPLKRLKGNKGRTDKQISYVQYAILRNLGWARLKQARYDSAKFYLQEAIQLLPDRISGHCLLAQVLEGQGQKKLALQSWKACRGYASKLRVDEITPELDTWIGIADERLRKRIK